MIRKRKLLLATAALGTAIGCGGSKKKDPEIYANPKGTHYDKGLADAGVDATAVDADTPKPPDDEIHANPKGAFYDDGLAKPPATK